MHKRCSADHLYRGPHGSERGGAQRNAKHAMIDLPEGLDEVGRG